MNVPIAHALLVAALARRIAAGDGFARPRWTVPARRALLARMNRRGK